MELTQAKSSPKVIPEHKDVITFKGLNRLPKINPGELKAMKNLSSMYPGCIYPRPPRSVVSTLTSGTALFSTNNLKLCWVDGTGFYYDGVLKGAVTAGAKSMVDLGGYVLIFPDKKYYNYLTSTFGIVGNGTAPVDGEAPTAGQCPDMDMICIFNNRVWGMKNQTMYGSKFNDPMVWSQFSVPLLENDSVYFKVSSERGNLVGMIPLENHIVFTTKNSSYELYGTKPSNYIPRLVSQNKGCIDYKSMVEIDGSVFILSATGINEYSGSYPRPVSYILNEKYVSGKAGTDGTKYYISLYNGTAYTLYVYDTMFNLWHVEDDLNVLDFTLMDGSLYALASDNKIYRFNYGTEVFSWEGYTDRLTEEYMGKKATSKIKVEAEIETGGSIAVWLSIDGGTYTLASMLNTVGYRFFKLDFIPQDAFYFQIKFVGTGIAKIYSITRELIISSDM